MTQEHPITPPPELVKQWATQSPIQANDKNWYYEYHVATQAARWGSDQELEACEKWLKANEWIHSEFNDDLRAARRPKPPSLKERALEALKTEGNGLSVTAASVIRRALEALPDD